MRRYHHTYSAMAAMLASPTEPLPQDKRDFQLLRMHGALASIESGQEPNKDDWRCLADAANLLESLIALGHVQDQDGSLEQAGRALAEAGKRAQGGRPLRFDGSGIQAVRNLLENYAECLNNLSARVMVTAHRHCEKRMQDIMAGRRRAHDVEVVAL